MCYFSNALESPQVTVDTICHTMGDPKFGRIDQVVGTGVSGIIALLPVSMQSGIPCMIIRKPREIDECVTQGGCHSDRLVENVSKVDAGRYVIIDDSIDSGRTIRRIIETMIGEYPHSECVGIILYQENSYYESPNAMFADVPITRIAGDIDCLQEHRIMV